MKKNTAESHLRKLKGQSLQLAVVEAVRQKADDNARRVYDVIKSFRDTGTPYSKIATHLNNLKVPTANGGKWYDSTVRRYNLRMNQ